MKKVLLLCSIAFMFSCSTENEINSLENEDIVFEKTATSFLYDEAYADSIFEAYFDSEEYRNTEDEIILFNSKVNNSELIRTYNSKAELFNWISANIELTNFESIGEAHLIWNRISNFRAIEETNFHLVYDFMYYAPMDLVHYAFEKWEPFKIQGDDQRSCLQISEDCRTEARNQYTSTLRLEKQSGNSDSGKVDEARDKYTEAQEECRKDYTNCMAGNR